ncbi:MAG: fluoride efflux transporter CrcB [Anaerolineae bacterium]
MQKILWVGIGGFAGAVLRYLACGHVQKWAENSRFPYGTIVVNLVGCLIIGLLSWLADTRCIFTAEMRSFVFIGLLGAFTTFSTFSNETLGLIQEAKGDMAVVNIGTHLVFGLVAVWGGRVLGRLIWR